MSSTPIRYFNSGGIAVRKLVVAISALVADVASAPSISAGIGLPTATAVNGSLYLRTNGTVYVRSGGVWVAAQLAAANFGAGPVLVDVVDESTLAAGVTVDGLLIKDASIRPDAVIDPGNAGAIPVTASGVCALTTAGVETRTLAIPTFAGQWLTLVLDTDVGDGVVTVAQAINQTGNNTITFNDVGDTVYLVAVTVGGALRWRVVANDGALLSTV